MPLKTTFPWNTAAPATLNCPPKYKFPATPTPPATVSAPVAVELDAVPELTDSVGTLSRLLLVL